PADASALVGRGQREEEARADADLALGPDPALVRLDDAARDRQAESGAAVGRLLAPPVALEQQRQLRRVDAGSAVADEEHDRVTVVRADRDPSLLGRDLERVADQIRQDLEAALGIDVDLRQAPGDVAMERDAALGGQRAE